jgi:prepilin-type N-terminal cleavage/methylation domain-containing protein
MHKAFTMIELIFVIVIIGILASITIPKFSATRMDAKLSTRAQNIMTSANEIVAYAIAKEGVTAHFSFMSNSITNMVKLNIADDTGSYLVKIKVEEISDCIILKITDPGENTETLIIEYGTQSSSNCNQLRSLIDNEAYPILLRGQSVIY